MVGLIVAGWALDILGIGLVASTELARVYGFGRTRLVDARERLGVVVKRWLAVVRRHLPKRLRRERSRQIQVFDAAVGADAGLARAVTRWRPPDDAPDDEKLAYLFERVPQMRDELDTVQQEIEQHPGAWRAEIQEARSELEGTINRTVTELREAHIRRRTIGVVCLAIGSSLLSLSSLLN